MFWTREEKARYLAKRVDEKLKRYLRHFGYPELLKVEIEEEIREGLEFIEKAEKGSGQSGL